MSDHERIAQVAHQKWANEWIAHSLIFGQNDERIPSPAAKEGQDDYALAIYPQYTRTYMTRGVWDLVQLTSISLSTLILKLVGGRGFVVNVLTRGSDSTLKIVKYAAEEEWESDRREGKGRHCWLGYGND